MAFSKRNIQDLKSLLFFSTALLLIVNLISAQPNLKKGKYQYSIVSLANKGFGYHIKHNNKIVIRQETIPAIQGNKAFATKADAEKCARLVVKKLAAKGDLPSISKEELIQLNIKI